MTRFGLFSLLLALCMPAAAEVVLLDDSASQVVSSQRQMQWRSPLPGRGSDHDVVMTVVVDLRLNTAAWVGRPARIHMRLARDSGPDVRAVWRTQRGRMLDGEVVSGDRSLIFAGTITQPLMEERLTIDLRTDGRWMTDRRRLQFTYELDEQ
ncbi:MAG: hypothetical protein ACO1OR_00120 [Hydrogenophaga sp.]|uniref:hypothetical protein n=1 Tax=Hydrogenophaga intermedia TaxID=65786 RepID=UPI0020440EDE|nr:hypothetical protein [Hydrogenophaga intermedia]MCM3564366.1 hypothetical protein [Hydrogenophaga intermedia]